MSSNAPESLDLDRDLPTSAEDVAALRRLRRTPVVGFADYLAELSRRDAPEPPERRKTFAGCAPFEL